MGRGAPVVGAVGGARAGAAVHGLRDRRRAASSTWWTSRSRRSSGAPPHPGARYELGCLYIGVNDVRALDWDAAAFEPIYARRRSASSRERCDRVLTVTAPLDLGAPARGRRRWRSSNAVDRARRAADAARWCSTCGASAARNLRDGRPRPPDRVRPDRDRRARAGRAGSATGSRRPSRPSAADHYETTLVGAPARRRDLRVPAREGSVRVRRVASAVRVRRGR